MLKRFAVISMVFFAFSCSSDDDNTLNCLEQGESNDPQFEECPN